MNSPLVMGGGGGGAVGALRFEDVHMFLVGEVVCHAKMIQSRVTSLDEDRY